MKTWGALFADRLTRASWKCRSFCVALNQWFKKNSVLQEFSLEKKIRILQLVKLNVVKLNDVKETMAQPDCIREALL